MIPIQHIHLTSSDQYPFVVPTLTTISRRTLWGEWVASDSSLSSDVCASLRAASVEDLGLGMWSARSTQGGVVPETVMIDMAPLIPRIFRGWSYMLPGNPRLGWTEYVYWKPHIWLGNPWFPHLVLEPQPIAQVGPTVRRAQAEKMFVTTSALPRVLAFESMTLDGQPCLRYPKMGFVWKWGVLPPVMGIVGGSYFQTRHDTPKCIRIASKRFKHESRFFAA